MVIVSNAESLSTTTQTQSPLYLYDAYNVCVMHSALYEYKLSGNMYGIIDSPCGLWWYLPSDGLTPCAPDTGGFVIAFFFYTKYMLIIEVAKTN